MRILTIDLYLCKEGESDTIIELTDLFDRLIGFWFLIRKLIARKAKYHEIIMRKSVPQGFEFFELGSEATLGSSIDDEHYFSFVGFEGDDFSIGFRDFDIVD